MCGIAGYLGPRFDEIKATGDCLARSLKHRGPDAEGQQLIGVRNWPDWSILLVHRRLAIIDLSSLGHQPMYDPETGNWIVYNGEIYNFKVLREEMRCTGVGFRSQSDTEVLLKGYARKDCRILNDLNGMFAFALWDATKNRLLLAVDPLGIKPLYYWTGPKGEFLFASEVRALLNTGLVPRRIDPVGLEGYLSYGAVQGPHTIITGIRTLLPGSYLFVSPHGEGEIDGPHTYWAAPFGAEGAVSPTKDRVEADIRDLLEEVVSQHLVSDVPVGAFLSGGIDSSSVVAIASQYSRDLRTFSVTFAEQEFSEAPYSREIARSYGLNHTELCLSEQDLLARLPNALNALDQPTLDGTNVYVISQAVREAGATVALSGQGGDEVFGGYPTFRQVPLARIWRRRLGFIPSPGWRFLGSILNVAQSKSRAIPGKLGEFLSGDGRPYSTYFLLRRLFPVSVRRCLFPLGGQGTNSDGLPTSEADSLLSTCERLDPVNLVSFLELRTYLANMLLRDGDVMSMAHGLEVRVPFLDRRIVEFMARLPGSIKMDTVLPKPLLLRPLGDRIPPSIYQRPKQGFTFPWHQWLCQRLRPSADEALRDADTYRDLGMNPKAIEGLWKAFLERRPGISWSRIWSLIVLREWAVRHEVRR
jgi:asparagine synthase (glutamine-hydrolysing)